ncbi:pentapeptide repeat-containing protein [Saccharothrix stipae]
MTPYLPAGLAFLVLLGLWLAARLAVRLSRAEKPTLDEVVPAGQRLPSGAKGPMAWALVKWVLLAVLLAAATGYGLYRLLGRPALPASTSFTTAELLDLLKIGLAVVGGLGAVVALAVGYRKQQVSEAAHVIATLQEERERTKFFNERYGKAAEQLGHENFAVRLAGVYAMAGLADDWPEQRQICVDVMCGYLRTPYPEADRTEREVRQEIITTLLDRVQTWPAGVVRMDFRGVEFEDLDLSRRSFNGSFTFDKAVFRGERTDFANCRFAGNVSFRRARFVAAVTSFEEIKARSATLDFSEAEFTGGSVDFSTSDLRSSTVDLTGAVLRGTTLTFRRLVGRSVTIALDGAELSRSTVDLSMVNVLSARTRSVVGLRAVEAEQCRFRFDGSRLWDADLRLIDAEFTDCAVELAGTQPSHVVELLNRIGDAGSR